MNRWNTPMEPESPFREDESIEFLRESPPDEQGEGEMDQTAEASEEDLLAEFRGTDEAPEADAEFADVEEREEGSFALHEYLLPDDTLTASEAASVGASEFEADDVEELPVAESDNDLAEASDHDETIDS
jgi:hypothetical protein